MKAKQQKFATPLKVWRAKREEEHFLTTFLKFFFFPQQCASVANEGGSCLSFSSTPHRQLFFGQLFILSRYTEGGEEGGKKVKWDDERRDEREGGEG